MTGSLSKTSVQHALSPQWLALLEQNSQQVKEFQEQTETWWTAQADALRADWSVSGLPTTRMEAWKYTSLAALHSKAREIALGPVDVKAAEGVRVFRLSQAATQGKLTESELARVRSKLESNEDAFFGNFAKSLVADPFIVWVTSGSKIKTPVEITWKALSDSKWAVGLALVVIGDGADVSVIERYGADVDAQTISTILDIGSAACVSHLRIQAGDNKAEKGIVLANTRAFVGKGAKYETSQISFGSLLSREDLTVELLSEEAETITDGVFVGRSNQVLDHHTNLVHKVGATTSRQIYKGVLSDESRGVFNGRIAIEKNASGSNSSQMNKNLLLSRKVELDTKPQLEIDNDDVKAAHGAAIGRLDPEHLFYLRSRGIEMGQAVEMLARGFAYEAIQRLSSAELRQIGTDEIERGLRGLSWGNL